MFNKTLHRPMFRKGGSTGSAGTGITSGLQAPRQGYDGDDGSFVSKLESTNAIDNYLKNNTEKNNSSLGNNTNIGNMTIEQMRAKTMEAFPDRKRNNKDLFIDFGLDLVSRPGSGGSIFENIGASGQKAYNQYRKTNTAADSKIDDRRADLFSSLIGAQGKIRGSEGAGQSFKDIRIAEQLGIIIPKIYEIEAKKKDGTATDDDLIQLDILKTNRNNYTKSNPVTEGAIDIFVKSPVGQNLYSSLSEDLLDKDLEGKYKDENDVQLYIDTIAQIKIILGQFSSGGRAGYKNGELVEEQVTETMDPGPMGGQNMNTDNPISYDQLRARLPAEITDDIVELISNSAEALEDFAMISDQSQVDQFNKKFSVNLVLPAEA
jgi:hypothetical protein